MCLKIKNFKLKIWILVVLCLAFIFPAKAYGQSLSLSIWPPLLEVIIQPGKTVTQVYKLTNNSDHELQISPQIFPFEPVGEKGLIRIEIPKEVRPPGRSDLSKKDQGFFSFENAELNQPFGVAVGQTKELVLKIIIPSSNPQNDYYYTLLFSTSEIPADKKSQSSSVTQIGSNILLTVSRLGTPNLSGKIKEFSAPIIIDSFSPTNFKAIVANTGSSFWKPFGKITITGILKQKDEIKLLEQNVLADSSRELAINSFKPQLPIGPFKASLEFSLNENETNKLYAETDFWYLPYKLFSGILILIILTFFVKKLRSRRV